VRGSTPTTATAHSQARNASRTPAIVAAWKTIERGGIELNGVACGIEALINAEHIELNALARQAQASSSRGTVPKQSTRRSPTDTISVGERVIRQLLHVSFSK
jgi:hypothetical protein